MIIAEKIREKGIKVTAQRKVIYQSLSKLKHASIDEIIKDVQYDNPEITVATIYRILHTFVDIELISEFISPSGKNYFDITPTPHHHYFTKKGEVIDYSDVSLTEMVKTHIAKMMPNMPPVKQIAIQLTID